MSEPKDNCTDDEEQSIEDDLKILNNMDIDKDFNVWSDFRNSFSVAKRESMRQLNESSRHSRTSVSTMGSIREIDAGDCEDVPKFKQSDNDSTCGRGSSRYSLCVKFSPLSSAERRDIRQWAVRLERTQVFSRYYFPEAWELREKVGIQKEFLLTEPLTGPKVSSQPFRLCLYVLGHCSYFIL